MRPLAPTLTALAVLASCAAAQSIAIVGGTVYPISGSRIREGTVLIANGRIQAVGAGLTIPAGATEIDARGKVVTPGLVHAWTDLGLSEVGSVPDTREETRQGDINPAFNVAEGINPQSITIPIARMGGLTTALTAPSGGLLSGQGVVIDLLGERIEDMVSRSPAVLVLDLSTGSKSAGGGSRAGVLQRLRQLFGDAREYARRRQDYQKNQMQPLGAPAPELEALAPALRGELPVFTLANRESDIESALRLAHEFGLRLVIVGGIEGWRVAPRLAQSGVPVIIQPFTDVPSFDGLGARLDNGTLLRTAGVEVALFESDPYNYRNLRFAAGNAVREGMTWDDALRAITLAPARAIGMADRYGSLEPGKVANVVVWSGDPFEFSTQAEHVFIRGVEVPRTSRQTELLERYRTLPPRY
jgi:imidazolonepropionase-like amidohydrolase